MNSAISTTPKCIILPGSNGSTENCISINIPSMGTIVAILVISWIILMAVAYLIYRFLNKNNKCVSYWWILLILIVSGLLVNFISTLVLKHLSSRSK